MRPQDWVRVGGGALFASGIYSSYIQQVPTTATFSYGLVSKYDLATGAELFNFYFGDATVSSAALGIWVANDIVKFVGLTGQSATFGGFQAWFVEANVGGSPARSLSITASEAKSVHVLPRRVPFGASKY